ncbi:MAG: hypothetical protein R2704_13280 [Microthrixaceae bacterium]
MASAPAFVEIEDAASVYEQIIQAQQAMQVSAAPQPFGAPTSPQPLWDPHSQS